MSIRKRTEAPARVGIRVNHKRNVLCLTSFTLHTLRHTFGSWLAIAGVPRRAIQKLMGHNWTVTAERYAYLGGTSFATATQKIEELLPYSLASSGKRAGTDPLPVP